MSKFKKLESLIEKHGYSKESAGAIAANAGRKKFGKKAMSLASKNHIPASQAKQELKKK